MKTKIENKIVELDHGIKLAPAAIQNLYFLQNGIVPEETCPPEVNRGAEIYAEYIRDAMDYILKDTDSNNAAQCKSAVFVLGRLSAIADMIKSFRVLSELELRKFQLSEMNEQ
ncbi:MAG: hypothetical protein K0B11_16500 [Mariniphaga sp.]|nr:hypothetical protein [Mariniphaga sp.]